MLFRKLCQFWRVFTQGNLLRRRQMYRHRWQLYMHLSWGNFQKTNLIINDLTNKFDNLWNYRWNTGNPFISKILDHFKGQEENNGICQTPDHMMAIVENQVQVTDFDEPSSCFITESCDNKYKLRKLIIKKNRLQY